MPLIIDHSNSWATAVGQASNAYHTGQQQGMEQSLYRQRLLEARERAAANQEDRQFAREDRKLRLVDDEEDRTHLRRKRSLELEGDELDNEFTRARTARFAQPTDDAHIFEREMDMAADTISRAVFKGKMPPDVLEKIEERKKLLREIKDPDPENQRRYRAAFTKDAIDTIEKDIVPGLKAHLSGRIGELLDNESYATDERSVMSLTELQKSIDQGAELDGSKLIDLQQKIEGIVDAHTKRDTAHANIQDFLAASDQALGETSAFRDPLSPLQKGAIREVQSSVKNGKLTPLEGFKEIEKLVGGGSSSGKGKREQKPREEWDEHDWYERAVELVEKSGVKFDSFEQWETAVNRLVPAEHRSVGGEVPGGGAQAAPTPTDRGGGQAGLAPGGGASPQGGAPAQAGAQGQSQSVRVSARDQYRIFAAKRDGDGERLQSILSELSIGPDTIIEPEPFDMGEAQKRVDGDNAQRRQRSTSLSKFRDVKPSGEANLDLPEQSSDPKVQGVQRLMQVVDDLRLAGDSKANFAPGEREKSLKTLREQLDSLRADYEGTHGKLPDEILKVINAALGKK